jgi:hypothetical protein
MISGIVGGKPVHCAFRLGQGSGFLAPGEYDMQMVSDPVHGVTVVLTPSGTGPAVPPDIAHSKAVASGKHMDPLAATGKVAAATSKHMDPMAAVGKVNVATQSATAKAVGAAGKHIDPMAATGKVASATGKHMDPMAAVGKVNAAADAAIGKHVGAGKHTAAYPANGQVFVLSAQPMQGRNCLVLTAGYADLIEALQRAGGGKLVVG